MERRGVSAVIGEGESTTTFRRIIAGRRRALSLPQLLFLAACCCLPLTPTAELLQSGDWTALQAREESLQVCRLVKQSFAAGGRPPPGGRIQKVDRLTDSSRIFFYHIAKSGGSSFAELLPRVLGSVMSRVTVSSPELAYPESVAATKALEREMGPQRLNILEFVKPKHGAALSTVPKWPAGANVVTREQGHVPLQVRVDWMGEGRPLLLSLFEAMQQSAGEPVAQVAFLRRPDERLGSQFHHDAVRGRGGCLGNPEEVVAYCLQNDTQGGGSARPQAAARKKMACVECRRGVELTYSNTVSANLLPASHLPNLQVLAITEHYELSVCLFMYTFGLRELFDAECQRTGLEARMAPVVNSADQQSRLSSQRKHHQQRYKSNKRPDWCGPACRGANTEDYEMWKAAVELFWWRVHEMAADVGVELGCN
eukprot:jgi/Tetstr1/423510/TSEL_014186.t1